MPTTRARLAGKSLNLEPGKPIACFDGLIYKVSTLAAGGFRITIDGTSQDIAQAAYLMPFADTPGVLVRVTFERAKPEEQKPTDAKQQPNHRKIHI